MTIEMNWLDDNALEVTIHGKLTTEDYAEFKALAEPRIEQHGSMNLLVHVLNMPGFTAGALWEDLKFDVAHYRDVERLAVVGKDSSKEWMASVAKPFTGAEVRFFPRVDLDAARMWVREAYTEGTTETSHPGLT